MPYLKELALVCHELDTATRRRFSNEVRSVCSLVTRLLPRIRHEKYRKILVHCVSRAPTERVVNQLGVAFVEVKRDASTFFSLTKKSKQRWAFDALQEGVLKVAHSGGFDPAELQVAFRKAEQLNFENVWRWKAKSSGNRRYKAEIWIEHDVEECRVIGVVTTHSGERLATRLLCTTEPDEWVFSRLLGDLGWEDAETAVLQDRAGQRVAALTVPSEIMELGVEGPSAPQGNDTGEILE